MNILEDDAIKDDIAKLFDSQKEFTTRLRNRQPITVSTLKIIRELIEQYPYTLDELLTTAKERNFSDGSSICKSSNSNR